MKKAIIALSFVLFSIASFARTNRDLKSTIKGAKKDVTICEPTLQKFYFHADCESFSWYDVEFVITMKINCDLSVEFYKWDQQEDLLCS